MSAIEVGAITEGKITGITNFGAFILLSNGQTGLVHISEVADEYVKDIKDFLKLNDTVKVRVLSIDKGRVGLSVRQAQEQRPRPERNVRPRQSFDDKLSRFLKESEERQGELKRSTDAKRGGRGGGPRARGARAEGF